MDDSMDTDKATFSGRQRRRTTSLAVKLANALARTLITFGGLSTIVAVAGMCVFLVWVVVPMFLPPKVEPLPLSSMDGDESAVIRQVKANEYNTMAWTMDAQGKVNLLDLTSGKALGSFQPFGDRRPTALAFSIRDGHVVAGFADGSVQYGTIAFTTRFIEADQLPDPVREAAETGPTVHEEGVIELTPEGQYRLQMLSLLFEDPTSLTEGIPIRLVDISYKSSGPVIAAFDDEERLHIAEVSTTRNLLTGKTKVKLYGGQLAIPSPGKESKPFWLGLAGLGDNAFLVWPDGHLVRVDSRVAANLSIAESFSLAPEGDAPITALGFLLGKTSLVSGDARGRVRVWFRTKPGHATTVDGATLVLGHELPAAKAAVSVLAASTRSRMLAVGDADGKVDLYYATNNRRLAEFDDSPLTGGIVALDMAPKDDMLYALGRAGLAAWTLDAPHPEASVKAIFGKVWYEGYNEPEHVWQSSSGTDDFEPKYGLMPLVFGTVKATVFAMLFAVPLALLAAVYSSEILHPRARAVIKPTIEMMASLPSVVLGFLAALVIAPFAEDVVPSILAALVTVPVATLLGAHLWQLLPPRALTVLRPYRLWALLPVLVLGVYLAALAGPAAERIFFGGDLKAWLATGDGSGAGGWLLPLLPTAALVLYAAQFRWFLPWWRHRTRAWPRTRYVWAELARYLVSLATAFLVAWLGAWLLADVLGWDPRGGFIDTYVQRNALIVGFVMGFAVIPIIYTLTEDALNTVPEQLRSASLGAGATPWQTAMRIILPTAASGIFSAVMIGFGRAVGETMIVLMAAGNTPLMEWNIFNGFRTLSANIAVEMPEAVKDSTHFRMLFLAALALFVMTFVLNSVAEMVRQRYRKRAYQL